MVDTILLTSAIAGFINVGILVFIGTLLIYKYKKYKYQPMIFWGISMFSLAFIYSYGPISSTLILMGQAPLTAMQVSLFYNAGPVSLAAWVIAWGEILYKERVKLIAILVCVFAIFLTSIFFVLYISNPDMLMTFTPPNTFTPGPWIQLNGLVLMAIFLLTGTILWLKGRKSDDQEIRMKGFFFLLQSILITVGSLIAIIAGIVFELLAYTLVIMAGIFLYISQVWPDWAKKIFLRNK